MIIHAKGTASVEGVDLTWQEIKVRSKGDIIQDISYGKYTVRIVKDEFKRLLRKPESYYAVPEYPKPKTMKAAIVAINTIWRASDITIDGSIESDIDKSPVEGRIY